MTVNMIIRRVGDYDDPRLKSLRAEGIPLLKRHGARRQRGECLSCSEYDPVSRRRPRRAND